ncbi:MAG: hypothetical protein BMS9Abin31_0578 [Gammaproteobacteria bacterium]|nr:MAG: hypothetical protein BMS9Abin31_0578 [Gammaproteobacteria bacterium]
MALITRISRLFRADFNAVLDRIEEPDVLLKQALREMEEDVHSDAHKLKLLEKKHSQVKENINELEEDIARINQELDICFESNEVSLARSQVKRKIEILHYEKYMKSKLKTTDVKISELKSRITENKARLTVMQQKLDVLINAQSEIERNDFSANVTVDENEVEMAFLKEKQARSLS